MKSDCSSDTAGRGGPLRLGFIPVSDCAPLIVARESGLFEKYELEVELRREATWTHIRDHVVYGMLDAAHAPATLPFLANLALESDRCACVTGMVLSLQGNAITVSRELSDLGVRDAATLRDAVYGNWAKRTYTFAVPSFHSPSHIILRQWLRQGGVVPEVEVRIVSLPPTQMFPTLKLGYIDGYCAGEPWASLAVAAKVGIRVAASPDVAPLHPEKVLIVRRDFAEARANEHERLIAALLEACAFCDRAKNRALIAEMLSQPCYLNAPAECIARGLAGLDIFHRRNANDPTDAKAAWIIERLYDTMEESVAQPPAARRAPVLKNIFRRDIYQSAKAVMLRQAEMLNREVERYHTGSGSAG